MSWELGAVGRGVLQEHVSVLSDRWGLLKSLDGSATGDEDRNKPRAWPGVAWRGLAWPSGAASSRQELPTAASAHTPLLARVSPRSLDGDDSIVILLCVSALRTKRDQLHLRSLQQRRSQLCL